MDSDFYSNAVEVLQTLVNALSKRGRYQNSRRRQLCRFRNYRARQVMNRKRGRVMQLNYHKHYRAREPPIRAAVIGTAFFMPLPSFEYKRRFFYALFL